MKLSDGEKLIAYMLAELMEKLEIQTDLDPAFIKMVVANDDTWAIRWKYNGMFHNEGPSDDEVQETGRIMTMCRIVENSIASLSEDERNSIDEYDRKVFRGFDGNHDPHYGVAEMLVHHLDRFDEWSEAPLNSHSTVLGKYRSMLAKFDDLTLPPSGKLSLEQIHAVLSA